MKDATFRDIVSTVQHRMAKTNLHEERIILTTNQLIFSLSLIHILRAVRRALPTKDR